MDKIYERVNWKDYPDTETPINSENLNKMDEAIDKIDERVANIGSDAIISSDDASKKTTTYTESTAESPPASGGKLPAIIGWCIGKIKALLTEVTSLNSNLTWKNAANDIQGTSRIDLTSVIPIMSELNITTQVSIDGTTYRTSKRLIYADLSVNTTKASILLDGGYANTEYNRFVEITLQNGFINIQAFYLNGTDYKSNARTWVNYR